MAKSEVTANDITKLRDRFKQVELAKARLDERRKAALAARKEAEAKLEELGFDPKTAEEELSHLYYEVDEKLTELESLLDL